MLLLPTNSECLRVTIMSILYTHFIHILGFRLTTGSSVSGLESRVLTKFQGSRVLGLESQVKTGPRISSLESHLQSRVLGPTVPIWLCEELTRFWLVLVGLRFITHVFLSQKQSNWLFLIVDLISHKIRRILRRSQSVT